MPEFGIAIGHDADPEDVVAFVPYQPLTEGLQFTSITPTAGGVVKQGPFIRFVWGIMTEAQFRAMMTQAGVLSADVAEVTVYCQDENYDWGYRNAKAHKPELKGRRGFHLNNVPLLITDIQVG